MDLSSRVGKAVQHFWITRDVQSKKQGSKTGKKDAGSRRDATGGAQLDGFSNFVSDLLQECGIEKPEIWNGRSDVELPGWFRPEKKWDLLVVSQNKLIAAIEFKAHIGPSFGNNYNNRTEEALGNATDILAAFRQGAFKDSLRPWLGYLMLVEDTKGSRRPVSVKEPHFPVFEEFRGASYIQRYEVTLRKLVREQLYDAACLLASDRKLGKKGLFSEPSTELSFQNFAAGLMARAIAHVKTEK